MQNNEHILQINPFEDDRGKLQKILVKSALMDGMEIEEVYVLYSNKDTVRGNHYHKQTTEYFTVLSGEALMVLSDISLSTATHLRIKAEDNLIIKVEPFTIHAIKNESEEPLIVLAVSTKEYKPSDTDTYPVKII